MNVIFVGNFEGVGWDGSITDENHIAEALEEFGHNVIRQQRDNIIYSNSDNIDFTLIAQYDGYDMKKIKNLPKPIVFWSFDYQNWGQQWCEDLIAISDLYLSKRIADSKYPNWQWLSQDFAPSFLDKLPFEVEKDIDVLFTGSYLPWATERNETLKAVDDKFNLRIHGVSNAEWTARGFKNVHGPVMDEGLPELYARAKVILSIDHTLEAGYWSDRNAQIMACGVVPLFRYIPLSETVFRDHVVYFYNIEDCLSRIEQLLERPQEDLDSAGEGAYEYAQNYLMVQHRVRDLLTIVGSIL